MGHPRPVGRYQATGISSRVITSKIAPLIIAL
jgi:hypothetical protein